MTARWVEFHGHSGVLVSDGIPVVLNDFAPLAGNKPIMHMDRAVYVTAQCEAPRFGVVQSYDGAAMSGGLLHNVAVLPASLSQGDLFALLAKIFEYTEASRMPSVPVSNMRASFQAKGWAVAKDGVLRDATGSKVSGQAIRDEFTPPDGRVPQHGPQYDQALRWANLFHDLFSDPRTKRPQIDYAAQWMARGKSAVEMSAYQKYVPALDSPIHLPSASLPASVDLAMCVYHAFSVNAPTPAADCLQRVMDAKVADADKFAAALIRRLGTREFGKWTDKPGDGDDRYDRTRKAVWNSGLWDINLAHQLMPQDL